MNYSWVLLQAAQQTLGPVFSPLGPPVAMLAAAVRAGGGQTLQMVLLMVARVFSMGKELFGPLISVLLVWFSYFGAATSALFAVSV